MATNQNRARSNGGGASSVGYLFGGDDMAQQPLQEHNKNLAAQAAHYQVKQQGQSINGLDVEANSKIDKMVVKDLRIYLRERGLSPAGSRMDLQQRLKDFMGSCGGVASLPSHAPGQPSVVDHVSNNYARPGGQNVGNFITDRNSSRVLAPPGGTSQISFG